MLKERLDAEPKIHVLCNEEVEDVGGDELLSEIVLKNTKTGEETVLHADEEDGFFGLFGFTGKKTTGMFDGVLDMEGGYIKTDVPVLKLQRSSFSSCNNSFQNGSSNESSCQNKWQHCNSST